MMLSPAAARMGKVLELGRKKGRRSFLLGRYFGRNCDSPPALTFNHRLSSTRSTLCPESHHAAGLSTSDAFSRWKSTIASYDDELEDNYIEGDTPTSVANNSTRNTIGGGNLSHEEAWMINLGRDDNNAWLTGPRGSDEWFTGKQPSICPGADSKGKIRSLPLPRLDQVTRDSALEYFDNSWTLYETLFAGLNGEEYFYRYAIRFD